jgi:hypothetical protein
MAWPYDDRSYDFTPLGPVPSDDLNEIQDRIIDLHTDRSIALVSAFPGRVAATDAFGWYMSNLNGQWYCAVADISLMLYGSLPSAAIIKSVHVKWKLAAADGMLLDAFVDNHNYVTADGAPTEASLGAQKAATAASWPKWGVSEWTGLSYTIGAGESIRVVASAPDVDDLITGVKVVFTPLTASP